MAIPFNSLILSLTMILVTLHLLSLSSPFHQKQVFGKTMDLVLEEKTRLGSRPPSCHNKCNQCHPCMAIQVPTRPSHHNRVDSSLSQPVQTEYGRDSSADNKYSDYKPLGWKCRCKDHFYNP